MIKNLQVIHTAGYTYNDLKLDNILVGNSKGSHLDMLRLVDFGFAARFLKKDGTHMPVQETEYFRGNMIFASINLFNFQVTSRRDDLISLVYMLVFMFNQGNLPFISEDQEKMGRNQIFSLIKKAKQNLKVDDLCLVNYNPT